LIQLKWEKQMVVMKKEGNGGSRCWAVVVDGLVLVGGLTKGKARRLRDQLQPLTHIVQRILELERTRILGEIQSCFSR